MNLAAIDICKYFINIYFFYVNKLSIYIPGHCF